MTTFPLSHDGAALRIGIVQSRFNESIVSRMTDACRAELVRIGVAAADIDLATVPGALEIPLALQAMALTGRYHALVALGAVIRGETYHFEVVSNESARGVMDVSLQTGVPVANAILTTHDDAQAEARVAEKAAEAARVSVEMARLLQAVKGAT
ncbi:MAG: 6,7-dimethyl-8-ribityllumazine synthase [Betaproteobacteria bacterium]|nr:6,7-dimethyl-8-ribityllumazine synthase [Betaproteobacteria bacterium]